MSFLEGKKLNIYTEGGFVFTGRIIDKNNEFVILTGKPEGLGLDHEDRDIYLFKNKIISFEVIGEVNMKNNFKENKTKTSLENKINNFPQNDLSYNENYASLPETLLQKPIENDEDFSVFFGSKKNNSGRVTFSTGNKNEDE